MIDLFLHLFILVAFTEVSWLILLLLLTLITRGAAINTTAQIFLKILRKCIIVSASAYLVNQHSELGQGLIIPVVPILSGAILFIHFYSRSSSAFTMNIRLPGKLWSLSGEWPFRYNGLITSAAIALYAACIIWPRTATQPLSTFLYRFVMSNDTGFTGFVLKAMGIIFLLVLVGKLFSLFRLVGKVQDKLL